MSPLYNQNAMVWISYFIYDAMKTGLALSQNNYLVRFRTLSPTGIISINTALPSFGKHAEYDNRNDNMNMMLQCMVASRRTGVNWVPMNPFLWGTSYVDPTGQKTIKDITSRYKKELYQLLASTLDGYPYDNRGDANFWQGEFNKLSCGCNCVYNDQLDSRETDENGCVNMNYSTSSASPPAGSHATDPTQDTQHPWTTTNRWEHWRRNFIPDGYNEFAGVDFMEAFGAYIYKMHGNMGLRQNIRKNLYQDFPKPYLAHTIGNPKIPFYDRAVFSLNVQGLYKGEVDGQDMRAMVSLNAGSNIDFEPGFYAEWGSVVDAQIKPFECTPQEKIFGNRSWASMLKSASGGGQNPSTPFERDEELLEDLTFNLYMEGQYDTTLVANTEDSLFIPTTDTTREQFLDSNIIRKWMNETNDTMYIVLDSCWAINEQNEFVNICDAQNRPLSAQKLSLNAVRLYPVPARDILFLDIAPPTAEALLIQIVDVLGRDVTSACTPPVQQAPAGPSTIRIQTTALAPGTYLLRLRLADAIENRTFTVLH